MSGVYKVEAIEREAKGETWDFEFDGETYHLPSDFDYRAVGPITGGELEEGLHILLGDEQFERLDASPKSFGLNELLAMLNKYCEDIGVPMGEFQASSRSSRRAAMRSKRTSNGSTKSPSKTSSRAR